MITIKKFVCNMLQENCYVVSDDTGEAVVIDCGALYEEERAAIVSYIRAQQLTPRHLLCTHGHFDHVIGNNTIEQEYGLKPEIALADQWLIEDVGGQFFSMIGMRYDADVPPVGKYLSPHEVVSFGTHSLTVLPTPGHTPGSVLFYCQDEGIVFSGDTLFRMSIGRTDFERGSWEDMMKSLQEVVAQLPADTKVYCGHGPETTIAEELRMNPYLRS